MGNDYQAELLCGAGPQAAGFFEGSDHAVEGNVLAEKENLVLTVKVIIKVSRREVGGRGNAAHAGFGEATHAELFSGSTQDFQAAGKIAALNTGLVPGSDPFARQFGLLAARTTDIPKVTRRGRNCQQNTNECSDNEQPFSLAGESPKIAQPAEFFDELMKRTQVNLNCSARKEPRGIVVQNLALGLVPNRQCVELLNVALDFGHAGPRPVRSPENLIGNIFDTRKIFQEFLGRDAGDIHVHVLVAANQEKRFFHPERPSTMGENHNEIGIIDGNVIA